MVSLSIIVLYSAKLRIRAANGCIRRNMPRSPSKVYHAAHGACGVVSGGLSCSNQLQSRSLKVDDEHEAEALEDTEGAVNGGAERVDVAVSFARADDRHSNVDGMRLLHPQQLQPYHLEQRENLLRFDRLGTRRWPVPLLHRRSGDDAPLLHLELVVQPCHLIGRFRRLDSPYRLIAVVVQPGTSLAANTGASSEWALAVRITTVHAQRRGGRWHDRNGP